MNVFHNFKTFNKHKKKILKTEKIVWKIDHEYLFSFKIKRIHIGIAFFDFYFRNTDGLIPVFCLKKRLN